MTTDSQDGAPVVVFTAGPGVRSPDANAAVLEKARADPEFRTRYTDLQLLGAGTSGVVCRAHARASGTTVAIKFLTLLANDDARRRFVQEGRLLQRLRHPNLVKVCDSGLLAEIPYMVTEYVPGGSLRDALKPGVPLDPGRAVTLMRGLLDALDACHSMGVIHRDLKPENILLADAMSVKLVDFGLAKSSSSTAAALTQADVLIGTPHYMAPEQFRLETATTASDIYAAGLILYEMLAGRHPYPAASLEELIRDFKDRHAARLPPLPASVPPWLARAAAAGLEPRPEDRPASARAFAAQLQPPVPIPPAQVALPGRRRFVVAGVLLILMLCVLRIKPTWPVSRKEALVAEALDDLRGGRFKNARARIAEGLALDPDDPRFHSVLGQVQVAQDQWVAAQSSFGRTLQLDPQNTYYLAMMGYVFHKRGRPADALPYLWRARKGGSGLDWLPATLAECLDQTGEKEEARRVWRKQLETTRDHKSLIGLLGSWIDAKDWPALEAYGTEWKQKRPDLYHREAMNCIVLLAIRNYPDRAIAVAEQLAAAEPMEPEPRVWIARCRMTQSKFGAAIEALLKCARLAPKTPDIWTRLGDAYYLEGKLDLARQQYETALKLEPACLDHRLRLAVTKAMLGEQSNEAVIALVGERQAARYSDALDVLCHQLSRQHRHIEVYPFAQIARQTPVISDSIGPVLYACNAWFGYREKMREFFEANLEHSPTKRYSVYVHYCEFLLRDLDAEAALQVARSAVGRVSPAESIKLEHLVKKGSRSYEELYRLFNEILEPSRDDLIRYLKLLVRKKKLPAARAELLAAPDREPKNGWALAMRAELHRLDHRPDLAVADYRNALKVNPGTTEFHDGLAVALYEAGQLQEARAEERQGRHLK